MYFTGKKLFGHFDVFISSNEQTDTKTSVSVINNDAR